MVLWESASLLGLYLAMIVQVIIPPIPAELIVILASDKYGVLVTTLVSGFGLFTGSMLVYYVARIARHKLDRFFKRSQVKQIVSRLHQYRHWLLWIRVLPHNPSDIIAYAAGVARFDQKQFIIVTFVTSFIRCFILALLGEYVESIKTILVVVSILVISGIAAAVLTYGNSKKQ